MLDHTEVYSRLRIFNRSEIFWETEMNHCFETMVQILDFFLDEGKNYGFIFFKR